MDGASKLLLNLKGLFLQKKVPTLKVFIFFNCFVFYFLFIYLFIFVFCFLFIYLSISNWCSDSELQKIYPLS